MVRPLSFMEVKKRASRHESTDTGWLNRGYSQGVLFTWGWAAAAELCSEKKKRKKLLKITNYPSLAAYRTIPEPQRMPAVLTLTETTHVTQSKSSSFFFSSLPSFFFSLSLFRLIWSVSLCLSAFTSVSPLLCLCVVSKANKCCAAIGSNRWENVSLEKTVIQLYNNMIRLLRCDTVNHSWGKKIRFVLEWTLGCNYCTNALFNVFNFTCD